MNKPPHARHPLAAALAALAFVPAASAAPQGGHVTQGTAAISQSGQTTTIRQATSKAAIDWRSFNIGKGESVQFVQPGASSVALNRVTGGERSVIDGILGANGQVFLINARGVLFTKNSRVDTGALVASTRNLGDADFIKGRYAFAGDSAASVVNEGQLRAAEGGYVALLSDQVVNRGLIDAPQGAVAMAGGRKLRLALDGDALIGMAIDERSLKALVDQQGTVRADGGAVWLRTKSAGDLLAGQVNVSGIVQARTIGDLTGRIVAYAEGGTATVSGTLDASAPHAGRGGFVETSGDAVRIAKDARITTRAARGATGTWLVDPDGYVVGAGGDITGAELGRRLADNNVTLQSTEGRGKGGNVEINDTVTWGTDTTLTVEATRNIDVNAAVTATGARAGLTLNAGQNIHIYAPVTLRGDRAAIAMTAGGDYHIHHLQVASDGKVTVLPGAISLPGAHASLTIDGTPYTLIHSMAELAALSAPVLDGNGRPMFDDSNDEVLYTAKADGYYALAQDLDASGKTYPSAVVVYMSGSLTGLGHAIRNLRVQVEGDERRRYPRAALIGTLGDCGAKPKASVLRDLRLENVRIDSGSTAGGLVDASYGKVTNVYVGGTVLGVNTVGGVIGENRGVVDEAHADVAISALQAGNNVGGAVGFNVGAIRRSSARGTIDVAGISQDDGNLETSAAIGGLAGTNFGVIDASSAHVDITALNSMMIGGLVGSNLAFDAGQGVITNSSAGGNISVKWTNSQGIGQSYGGLVGDNADGTISGSTASGNIAVSAAAVGDGGGGLAVQFIGGLVGSNSASFGVGGKITDSHATGNVTTTGQAWYVGGAVGVNVDGALDGVTASGNVSATVDGQYVGNLFGDNQYGTVVNSIGTGKVTIVPPTQEPPPDEPPPQEPPPDHPPPHKPPQQQPDPPGKPPGKPPVDPPAPAKPPPPHKPPPTPPDDGAQEAARLNAVGLAALQNQAALSAAPRPVRTPGTWSSRSAALAASVRIEDLSDYSATVRRIEVDGQVFDLTDDEPPATKGPRKP